MGVAIRLDLLMVFWSQCLHLQVISAMSLMIFASNIGFLTVLSTSQELLPPVFYTSRGRSAADGAFFPGIYYNSSVS